MPWPRGATPCSTAPSSAAMESAAPSSQSSTGRCGLLALDAVVPVVGLAPVDF